MITTIIITVGMLAVFIIGRVQVHKKHSEGLKKFEFAREYRNRFVDFSNIYFKNNSIYSYSIKFDEHEYEWLTKNVVKMQKLMGTFGVAEYIAPKQSYTISNYQPVVNAIPKFRDNTITDTDFNGAYNSLLHYIGYLEECKKDSESGLQNPFVWFREGFRYLLGLPFYVLNRFGIINFHTVNSIKHSFIFKIIAGIVALVSFISGVINIIDFLKRMFGN